MTTQDKIIFSALGIGLIGAAAAASVAARKEASWSEPSEPVVLQTQAEKNQELREKLMRYHSRSASEMCQSDSAKCGEWLYLAESCGYSMKAIDAGQYDSKFRGSCGKAETFREQVTGVELSTAPGAFTF